MVNRPMSRLSLHLSYGDRCRKGPMGVTPFLYVNKYTVVSVEDGHTGLPTTRYNWLSLHLSDSNLPVRRHNHCRRDRPKDVGVEPTCKINNEVGSPKLWLNDGDYDTTGNSTSLPTEYWPTK